MFGQKSNDRYLRACYYVKRILYLMTGAPSFDQDHIDRLRIQSNRSDPFLLTVREFGRCLGRSEELEQFEHNSNKHYTRYGMILLVCLYFTHITKDLALQFIVYSLVDRKDVASNIMQSMEPVPGLANQTHLITYLSCLKTNCTRLSSNSFVMDISRLPFFKLCLPGLAKYYRSVSVIDPLGLALFTMMAFGVVLLALVLPLRNLIKPMPYYGLMFIVAPQVVTDSLCGDLRILLDDMSRSWNNYLSDLPFSSISMTAPTTIAPITTTPDRHEPLDSDRRPGFRSSKEPDLGRRYIASSNYTNDNTTDKLGLSRLRDHRFEDCVNRKKVIQKYLDECLPAVRTDWWRLKISRSYILVSLLIATCFISTTKCVWLYLDHRATKMLMLYREYSIEMDRLGCKIWYNNDGDISHSIAIDLANQQVESNLWNTIDSALTYALVLTIALALGYDCLNQQELKCWLSEIFDACKLSLHLLSDFNEKYMLNHRQQSVNLIKSMNKVSNADDYVKLCEGDNLSSICVRTVRKKFMQNSHLGIDYGYERSLESLEIFRTVEYLIDDNYCIEQIIKFIYELLEKYYLSTRLFLTYVDNQAHVLSLSAIVSYLVTIGMAVLCMIYIKQTNSFGIESVILISVGMILSNMLMLMPANLNAKVSNNNTQERWWYHS